MSRHAWPCNNAVVEKEPAGDDGHEGYGKDPEVLGKKGRSREIKGVIP